MDLLVDEVISHVSRDTFLPETDVEYEMCFTRNKDLISQYKLLRKQLYETDHRFVGFRIFKESDAEDYEDLDNHMLILFNGNECYGGACLRISTPEKRVTLDLENDIVLATDKKIFSLREHFPEMELEKYAYAELSRVVIHPSLRKGKATRGIFQAILRRCIDYRVRYLVGIGDKVRTRLYKQIYHAMGLDAYVRDDVDICLLEEYEGLKMYLLVGDMKPFHMASNDTEAKVLLKPRTDYEYTYA